MLTHRTFTLAAAAAALAAMTIASWHQSDAQALEVNVQTPRPHRAPGDTNAEAAYLPSLFIEEERAARIEPMPPQF